MEQRKQQVLHIHEVGLQVAGLDNGELYDEGEDAVLAVGGAAFGYVRLVERHIEVGAKVGKPVCAD